MEFLPKRIMLSYVLQADRKYLDFLRSEVAYFLSLIKVLDESMIFKFKLILDELVNNAIEHGSDENSEIIVDFLVENRIFTLKVSDEGKGKNKKTAEQILDSIEYSQKNNITNNLSDGIKRGRGLTYIVNNFADKMEILNNEKGGITVIVYKKI